MTYVGVVGEFNPDKGWGVIDGLDVPGGVHLSAVAVDGLRLTVFGLRVDDPGRPGADHLKADQPQSSPKARRRRPRGTPTG
jgi:cold shock CspA family protein